MKEHLCVFCGFGLFVLLATLAGTADGAAGLKKVALSVSLQATVTKEWNTVVEDMEDGCPTAKRSIGRRTITLRSVRPSRVVVTYRGSSVSYSPATIRYIAVGITQTGSRSIHIKAPCRERTVRTGCARVTRSVGGARLGFYRSRRNEISFHPARLPGLESSCPGESADVRALRPSLHDAQGEISESTFSDSRIGAQTSLASSEATTDLEGDESGQVVERVQWALTFARARHPTG
jgi:hypothetical protein